MYKPFLIHNDNSPIKNLCRNSEVFKLNNFDFGNSNLDSYISHKIIPKLIKSDFNILFIKDNLSQNYIELYGILLAYHIRLSSELSDKRFVPIVIISELDGYILNKIDSMSNILFTKNIFIGKNNESTYKYYKNIFDKLIPFTDFQKDFLNLIEVNPPQDYLSYHDITNEWAIHQWSNALGLTTTAIDINHNKISSMLYFKYLKSLHEINRDSEEKYETISSIKRGKILYIDDEWAKGWSDILDALFEPSQNIEFKTFEYIYKDTDKDNMLKYIKQAVVQEKPDVVILDLRLSQTDHNKKEDIEQYTGIEVLKMIKGINPGIQVIMMTATRQSVILEKLYDYGVLGYIKKEHPDDVSVHTVENMDKLFKLTESGLGRKYLKDIFITQSKIENILKNDIFVQYISDEEKYEPFWIQLQVETTQVFDILSNSNSQNKFKYAMVSIASSLEAILSIFVVENRYSNDTFWDGQICTASTLYTKLIALFHDKFGYSEDDNPEDSIKDIDMKVMIGKRNDYLHSNKKVTVDKDEIKLWYKTLLKMIGIIQNPPNIKSYDPNDIVEKKDQSKKPKVVKKLKPSKLIPIEQRNKDIK